MAKVMRQQFELWWRKLCWPTEYNWSRFKCFWSL